jgi:uncharacterized protein (TIGR02246 family)
MSNHRDVEGIKELRGSYMSAQDRGDTEGCLTFWTDDGALMPPNEVAVVGKDALRSWYQAAFEQFKIDLKVTFDAVEVAGDWGFARGTYGGALVPKAGGQPIPDDGKYLEIHRRQPDGSWKFACHMWSSNSPP